MSDRACALRVALVIGEVAGGGAERAVWAWAQELVAWVDAVSVYTFDPAVTGSVDTRSVAHRNFRWRSRLTKPIELALRLRRAMRSDGVGVVVSSTSYPNLVVLLASRLLPTSQRPAVIIVEHNVASVLLAQQGRAARMQLVLARRCYRAADAAIGVSHAVVADLVGGLRVAHEHAFFVPNPVAARRQRHVRVPDDGTLRIGFVGRVTAQKLPLRLVDCARALRRRGVDARLIVVGNGELDGRLAAYAAAHGIAARHVGWTADWTVHAQEMNVLLLPSSVEGFGNVLVEAAAAGIPAVAPSTALGVADAILPGITGELAISGDADHLADAVLEAARRPLDAAIIDGWLNHFSSEASARILIEVIRHTVRARPS
ncbi:MAG TPA: glycosyltransferase [Solirubrobacteraceae bacterium]